MRTKRYFEHYECAACEYRGGVYLAEGQVPNDKIRMSSAFLPVLLLLPGLDFCYMT